MKKQNRESEEMLEFMAKIYSLFRYFVLTGAISLFLFLAFYLKKHYYDRYSTQSCRELHIPTQREVLERMERIDEYP